MTCMITLQESKGGKTMNQIFDNPKSWLKAALIRAIKTFAQTMIATIGTAVLFENVNWSVVISAASLAALLSILTSIAGLPEVED